MLSLGLQLFLLHLAAVASPGPDNLLVITYSHGKLKNSFLMALGLTTGIGIYTAAVLAGIGNFFIKYPKIYLALQIAGALYLLYLAFSCIKASLRKLEMQDPSEKSSKGLYVKALITFLTNPKAFLYFFSVLPPFIPENPQIHHYLLVVGIICFTSFMWFFSLGLLIGINKAIIRVQAHPYYLRFVGLLFGGLGIKVLLG